MTGLVMAYLQLGNIDPFEMVRAAARGGFKATVFRMTGHSPGDAWGFDPANAEHVARMKALAEQEGIELVNISTYRFVPGVTPEDYEQVLDACAALGVRTLTANSFEGDEDVVVALMAEVAKRAAARGIRIAIEFIPVSRIRTAADALRIAEATGCDNVGILVDALHLYRSGDTPQALAAIPRERIFAVQICDGKLESPPFAELANEMRTGRLLPGDGEFDIDGLLDALPADIEVEIEAPSASLAHLPPVEKARRALEVGEAYLAGYAARR